MLVESSAECAAEDPVLVVPWSDPDHSDRHFVDLRENPYDLDSLEEVTKHPPLMHALRALNAARSPVFTAKCDAWPLDNEELDHLHLNLDHQAEEVPAGFASYIDMLWRERSIFVSSHRQEQMLHRLARLAAPLDCPFAMAEGVIRPAIVDLTGPQEGFAVSLYVKALGHDQQAADANWASALDAIVALLRSKDLSFS